MSNNFKILYCTGSISVKGGTERVLANKSKIFAERLGIDIHIATLSDPTIKAYEFSNKIHFHHIFIEYKKSKYIPTLISNHFYKKKLYQKYAKVIQEINPNLVIVLERGTDDFYLPKICKELNIPIIREFHFARNAVKEKAKIIQSIKERLLYKLAYKRIFRAFNNYDYLVLLTKRDQIEGNYKTKTVVIPNIVPTSVHKANTLSSKIMISVGSMNDKRKGFPDIIRAWKIIQDTHPKWTLKIYGDGAERVDLETLVQNLKLENSVYICGASSSIEQKYCESAFFISASVAEGLPMVLIEAMGCGLPCVAYDCPTGPSDIIMDKENGYLVPFKNVSALADAIEQMINKDSNREYMSKKAIKTAQLYSEENIIPLWQDFFSKFGYINETNN